MTIPAPNYTQTPNAVYDALPAMAEAEMRVTLAICRETFGWHRARTKLSLSDIARLTGLSRQGVVSGITAGMERGLIGREADGNGFAYFINIEESNPNPPPPSQPNRPVNQAGQSTKLTSTSQPNRLVNQIDQSTSLTSAGQPNRPERVHLVDQHKGGKKKEKVKQTPPPTPASAAAGPFADGWDPAEALEAAALAIQANADDGPGGGGGGWEEYDPAEESTDMPETILKPVERVQFDGLVGGGGSWDADQYERSATSTIPLPLVGGGDPPSSAPPPTAADISWAACEQVLRSPACNSIQRPTSLRDLGLPYTLVLKKAKQLAKGGAGGGAIVMWFRDPANIAALRAEAARPVIVQATRTAPDAAPMPPSDAQTLHDRPRWCSAAAWHGTSAFLRVKLQAARLEDGWLWAGSRFQQNALNGKYRAEVILILQQSGITPAPPPQPKAPLVPSAWRAV